MSSSFLSVMSIFINDAPESKRGIVCVMFEPLARASFILYGSSFISIAIMIIFMPFGCYYPNQATYGIICGILSILSIIFVAKHTYKSFKSAEVSSSSSSSSLQEEDTESLLIIDRKQEEEKENHRILSQIDNTSSQGNININTNANTKTNTNTNTNHHHHHHHCIKQHWRVHLFFIMLLLIILMS